MNCPKCGNDKTSVIDSRVSKAVFPSSVRRRRICKGCKHRFSTFEMPLDLWNGIVQVVKGIMKYKDVLEAFTSHEMDVESIARMSPKKDQKK